MQNFCRSRVNASQTVFTFLIINRDAVAESDMLKMQSREDKIRRFLAAVGQTIWLNVKK